MYPYPNFQEYHRLIRLYLNAVKEKLFCTPGEASSFFAEMVYRSLNKVFQVDNLLGVGDLTEIGVDLIQDFNATRVAFGSQKALEVRYYHWEKQYLIDRFKKSLLSKDDFIAFGRSFAWQVIQEQAGLILLNLYLRQSAFCLDRGPLLFEPIDSPQLLRVISRDYYGTEAKDWKGMRCLFYRYLMYSGFIQVDSNCQIIKGSIAPLDLLEQLATRLIFLTGMEKSWNESKILEGSAEEILNPRQIAAQFLHFNEMAEK